MKLVFDRKMIMLMLLSVLLVIKFAYIPMVEHLTEQRSEVIRLKERVQRIDRAKAEIEHLQAQTAELDSALGKARSQFQVVKSTESVQFSFQKSLEEKASEVDISMDSIEWSETVSGTPSSSQIQLSFSGKLRDVMRFHHDIARLGYNVMTTDLDMSTQRQLLIRSRLGNAKVTLSLRIFYLLEES